MRIVVAYPPLIDEIDKVFNVRGKPIAYAWGDTIFNPLGGNLGSEIIVHEQVHGDRQGADVEAWWRRYLVDEAFRLDEEIPAHVAEYKKLCEAHRPSWPNARRLRRVMATHVAKKLSSPLYGGLISFEAAKKLLVAQLRNVEAGEA